MQTTDHLRRSVAANKNRGAVRRALAVIGPGVITGAADDDPAGIVTCIQAGARFQYALAWTALLQFPMLSAIQAMVGRVGLVTGRGFVRVIRDHYSAKVVWGVCTLLLVSNTITVGADLAGVGTAVELLVGLPRSVVVPIVTIALPLALVFARYHVIAGILKWLAIVLFAYVAAALLAHPNWRDVLHNTFPPAVRLSKDYLAMFVALFGGTISPYMLVWQSAEEVEELREAHKRPLSERPRAATAELRSMRHDTILGMAFSQLITYSVILAAGAAVFPQGIRNIESARQAALSLQSVGAGLGKVLFALGLIGSGLLASATLTGASAYALAATAGWRSGVNKKPRQARQFYAIICCCAVVAGLIGLLARQPMSLLVASQVINGIIAPPLLIVLLRVANDKRIVGSHTSSRTENVLAVVTIVLMGVPAIALIALTAMGR